MRKVVIIFLLIQLLTFIPGTSFTEMNNDPIVRIEQGALRGRSVDLEGGRRYYSFQGVPYAKPPTGPLRYRVAQMPVQWNDIKDARKEGNVCPQVDWLWKRPIMGDEDCLYLNIYTPKLPSHGTSTLMPAMVFIHGGGFDAGSGNTDFYGPEYFMEEDIVLLTINYRLGVLGFLSLENETHPENLGLKDQAIALRWIAANIKFFGGDPNSITLFGESAGAASVHYHMLSPMSKGLFHKAIAQSGSALNSWAMVTNPKEITFELAKELGSGAHDATQLLKFFEEVPVNKLIETYEKLKQYQFGRKWRRFGPVPETKILNPEDAFVPANVRDLIHKGIYHDVPSIFGSNSEEGIIILYMGNILKSPFIMRFIGKRFDTQVPDDFYTNSNKKQIADKIKKFYFGNERINEMSIAKYAQFASDEWFIHGINRAIRSQAKKITPVYYYNFDYKGGMNTFRSFLNTSQFTGASHMDELGYLFHSTYMDLKQNAKPSDMITKMRMIKMWTNFAKTGNPTPEPDNLLEITWPRFTEENPVFLNIDSTLSIKRDLYKNRMDFWDELYKI